MDNQIEQIEEESFKVDEHPFFAGVLDFYLVNVLVLSVISTVNTVIDYNILLIEPFISAIVLLLLTLGGTIIYHKWFVKKVSILTPGEYFAGRRLIGGDKIWTNPYKCSRYGIFAVILINVIGMGNTWDRGTAGYIYTYGEIAAKLIRIAIVLYALKIMSDRDINGIVILIVFTVFSGIGATAILTGFMRQSIMTLYIAILAIYLIVYFHYRKKIGIMDAEEMKSDQA